MNDADEKPLMQACIDLYEANQNYEQLFTNCRKEIISLLKKCNYQPKVPNKASNPNAMQHLPYVVKVLIYIMTYRAIELYEDPDQKSNPKEPTQQDILDFIEAGGYKLSHNTFTKFKITPRRFYDILNYEQIKLPVSYAGAKRFELGYAINYLTAYAGTLDNFVDLFSGAAYASMAVTQLNNTDYYINDKDFLLVNYYNVLRDNALYQLFITDISNIIKSLSDNAPLSKWTFTHCSNIIIVNDNSFCA